MKIIIGTIPHSEQRYDTVGDWQGMGQDFTIRVSESKDYRYNFLVAIHELVEVALCVQAGIHSGDVDAWDMKHDEAGDDPKAPYHRQHLFAEAIERLIALEMGVRWDIYESALDAL